MADYYYRHTEILYVFDMTLVKIKIILFFFHARLKIVHRTQNTNFLEEENTVQISIKPKYYISIPNFRKNWEIILISILGKFKFPSSKSSKRRVAKIPKLGIRQNSQIGNWLFPLSLMCLSGATRIIYTYVYIDI